MFSYLAVAIFKLPRIGVFVPRFVAGGPWYNGRYNGYWFGSGLVRWTLPRLWITLEFLSTGSENVAIPMPYNYHTITKVLPYPVDKLSTG